jgi:FkbM family methyltransferase
MTAMDIGANNGYYTLLMARRVETKGQVIAFEPSPREFQRLRRHIWMNRCTNVLAEQLGVADRCGSRALFVVNGIWPARNSLRPAKALNPLPVDVNTTTVDAYLSRHSEITRIDFIKLDVEGAELEVLEGAQGLLSGHSHPVILCELNDPVITECGWQHRAADVVQFLEKLGYAWFGIDKEGCLCQPPRRDWICGDFVFMPHGAPEPGQATALERSCAL